MTTRLQILLVEDNNEHLKLTKYALKQNGVRGDLHVVRDGQEAIDYLYQRNKFAGKGDQARPNLVLLDLNIPRVNGREVLQIIKGDKDLKDIPVVVVSSSNRPEDITFARENGASAYITKDAGFEKFSAALADLQKFTTPEPPAR